MKLLINQIRDNAAQFDAALKRRGLEALSGTLLKQDEALRAAVARMGAFPAPVAPPVEMNSTPASRRTCPQQRSARAWLPLSYRTAYK